MSDNIKLVLYGAVMRMTGLGMRCLNAIEWKIAVRQQRITIPRLLSDVEPMCDEEWEAFAEGAGFEP